MSAFNINGAGFGKKIVRKAAGVVKDKAIDYAKDKAKEIVMEKLNESSKVQELKSKATSLVMDQVNAHKEELISAAAKTLGMDESEIRQIWDTVADPERVITDMMNQAQANVNTNPSVDVDTNPDVGASTPQKPKKKKAQSTGNTGSGSYVSEE